MNLATLVDDKGLQQDAWSLDSPSFGKDQHLTVVGWSGMQKRCKLYILKCTKCSLDVQLFGEGYFRSTKPNLVNKQAVPCGCAKSPRRSKEQYIILCSRKAEELGYTFIGFMGDWKGVFTKIKMVCEKHGDWNTGIINNLINSNNGCPGCQISAMASANLKPDNVMTASFFASGAFHPETKFWRSERKDSQGAKAYWHVYCPECEKEGESFVSDLHNGQRPCGCNTHRQQEAYINLILDGHNITAIKFGIATVSQRRVKRQNSGCIYSVDNYAVYKFPDTISCKAAERECKNIVVCGVLSKSEMSDGYTETTYAHNIDVIENIYKKHGGCRI